MTSKTRPQPSPAHDARPHVVIVGAGFGGLSVARKLGGTTCRVTLIDRENFHLFVPLLYQVATAVLSEGDIAQPIRHILSHHANIDVFLDEVVEIDAADKQVITRNRTIGYDILVLATGSGQSYFAHPEWARYAPGLKTIEDATAIRNRLMLALEEAERTTEEAARRALMTVVLIGGGPTGVELAGSISELTRHTVRRDFKHIKPEEARIILIEATPRLLAAFPEDLADHTRRVLERRGVELRFNTPVEDIREGRVVAGGETIDAGTIVWTAGVAASPAGRWLGVETDRSGRIEVDRTLAVPGLDRVYALGDTVLVRGDDGKPLPGLAQVAKQQGLYLGKALANSLVGLPWPGPFRFRNYGNMATIGRN
ncbi:MAG TPA: NAD(P)/FAD-dependent oxidoreductase, partial [Alphaproteobacteria bacterium]|nr:NAD(P)/FAD-dependent oxidoreductase [Alphaproteobacteria bacterium]